MPPDSKTDRPALGPWLLRRADQAAVAVLVLVGLGGIGAWWIVYGGFEGRLVEVERAEPRSVRFQVDLNAAEWPELTQLPGIGEVLARRIVQSRVEEGPLLDQEDLQRVERIGPKTLERIRPYLRPMPSDKAMAGGEAGDGSAL